MSSFWPPAFSSFHSRPSWPSGTVHCCTAYLKQEACRKKSGALRFTHVTADKKHAGSSSPARRPGRTARATPTTISTRPAGGSSSRPTTGAAPATKSRPTPAKLDWQPPAGPRQLVWHVLPDSLDKVPCDPAWRHDTDYYCGQPYRYVTVAHGLPCGVHELTLIPIPDPNPTRGFTIVGVDVPRPPLARDAPPRTTER